MEEEIVGQNTAQWEGIPGYQRGQGGARRRGIENVMEKDRGKRVSCQKRGDWGGGGGGEGGREKREWTEKKNLRVID